MKRCRICDEALGSRIYTVREMHFGIRDEFEYRQCPTCQCLQINAIPEDLGKYYPPDYYSKKTKKQYSKPQLTRVRLAIQNPVLANCNSVAPLIEADMVCNQPAAPCADAATP